jgi:hypothetical protein
MDRELMKLRALMLLVPCLAAGCVTVRPVLTPAHFIPQTNPELVWVTQQSGEVIPVSRPSLQGDTLVGHWLGTSESVRLALPTLQGMSARQPDRRRTTLLVAGAGLLAGFFVWRALNDKGQPANCHFDGHEWTCI